MQNCKPRSREAHSQSTAPHLKAGLRNEPGKEHATARPAGDVPGAGLGCTGHARSTLRGETGSAHEAGPEASDPVSPGPVSTGHDGISSPGNGPQ